MKRILSTLTMLAIIATAGAANVTNLFPNGDFESGGPGAWVEGGPASFNYPSEGGNPGAYGAIDDTSPTWGIWVGGAAEPLSLESLGLTAGQTYTFVQDMKLIVGTSLGGLKVESWGPTGLLGTSGDMRPTSPGSSNWVTYAFSYKIHASASGLKIVPLWGPGSVVGFDNLGVVVPAPEALNVAITSPTNSQVVAASFVMTAFAGVYPGTVTNVAFYIDEVLKGNDTTAPFTCAVAGLAAGSHTLRAVAFDTLGNSASSANVSVQVSGTVNLPPSVAITSPAEPTAVLAGTALPITAAASDDGAITKVDFFVNGTLLGSDSTSPYSVNWPSIAAGSYALTAVAYDNGGLTATSAVVHVTALASLGAYEPFDYGALPNLTPAAGTGFAGNWTCVPAPSMVPSLAYTGLETGGAAMSSTGGRQFVSFAAPISSGTEWISFLCKQTGNPGGVNNGLYFLNGGTGLFVGYGLQPLSATEGKLGLGAINSVGAAYLGATRLSTSAAAQTYGTTCLVVLRLDFNTSGTNDTVTVYLNPTAHTAAPDVAPDQSISGFDVGVITGIGLNVGNTTFVVDEFRRGATYAEVVGGMLNPTVPTTLLLALGSSMQLSWAAESTNYYQLQESADNVNWTALGGLVFGTNGNSVTDPTPQPFYQVLELAPNVQEVVMDGGFEVDGGMDTAFYWTSLGTQPPLRITSNARSGGACMSLWVTNAGVAAQTSILQQNLAYASGGTPVSGDSTYTLNFWAKSLGKLASGGYVQQYRLAWLDGTGAVLGTVGWSTFNAATDQWSLISRGPVTAPAGAVNALLEIFAATGGIQSDFGGVLIDDVSLGSLAPGAVTRTFLPNITTNQVFVATIQANGTTASDATGTVQLTLNGQSQGYKPVNGGVAASDPLSGLPATYTVSAVYSGDATYIGSSATLSSGGSHFGTGPGSVVLTPTQATVMLSGIAGKNYSVQRATNVSFTSGLRTFPVTTAPAGGYVTVTDTFSDLGAKPLQAFYRLQFIP